MACSSTSKAPTCSKSFSSVFVSNDLMDVIKERDLNRERERRNPHTHAPPLFAHLTTMDELLNDVKNYILRHKLFDPNDPLTILLEGGNELALLLGRSRISLLEVRDILLEKFVFPVAKKNSPSEVICSITDNKSLSKKRKLDTHKNDSLSYEFSQKIKCLDGFLCATDRPHTQTSCYDTDESIHSFQNSETEFVKDSSTDDNFSVIIAETYDVDVEYEIESENSLSDSDLKTLESDSDLEDFVKTAVVEFIAENTDSDIEYLADESSGDESEKELSEEDKWRCACGTLNDPVMRCCCSCWAMRSGWLPEKKTESSKSQNERDPRENERERKELGKIKRKFSKKSNKDKDLNISIRESAPTADCLSSAPHTSTSDIIFTHTEFSSSKSLEIGKNNISLKTTSEAFCLLCCSRPANCSIIHSKVGCRICCYVCGQKLLQAKEPRCPTCRRTIEKVVYLYHL